MRHTASAFFPALLLLVCSPSCKNDKDKRQSGARGDSGQVAGKERSSLVRPSGPDRSTFSDPSIIRTRHIDLDLTVSFEQRVLSGHATLAVEAADGVDRATNPLVLDTRDLTILRVEQSADGASFEPAAFKLGESDDTLGAPLTIDLPRSSTHVRIHYRTAPSASGLQWLTPAQTAGRKHPFLYSQSQAIHSRSWIPLQDTPSIRVTYNAVLRVPPPLMAVMSAENPQQRAADGVYRFEMKQAIPSYLIALAVGDVDFQPVGAKTGVYAEKPILASAAREFEDMEAMMVATEKLYGPYRWGRFDVLVLPPSFPFGGMENPRLTFATPTIIAGDKSLVALISHELAHSWSGNLVTNATWRDAWLNEGFTVYVEGRIQEAIYGKAQADMEALLALQGLEESMEELDDDREQLHPDADDLDPDDYFSDISYEKGALFLRHLEKAAGRPAFDAFLKAYFDRFAFKPVTTADFVTMLETELLAKYPDVARKVPISEWLYGPGLPNGFPRPKSQTLANIGELAGAWAAGTKPSSELGHEKWTFHEWLHFLRALPRQLTAEQMKALDEELSLGSTNNSEVLFQWLLMSIRNQYAPSDRRLEAFLLTVGRNKFIRPLYKAMLANPGGHERARAIFERARSGYHPISASSIANLLAKQKPSR